MGVHTNDMHTISTTMLQTEQKWNMPGKKLASKLCHSKKSSFKSVIMSTNGILQKQQYTHGLKHDITIAPYSLVPTILYELHDSKGHQGTMHPFQALRRSYWWPKLCQ